MELAYGSWRFIKPVKCSTDKDGLGCTSGHSCSLDTLSGWSLITWSPWPRHHIHMYIWHMWGQTDAYPKWSQSQKGYSGWMHNGIFWDRCGIVFCILSGPSPTSLVYTSSWQPQKVHNFVILVMVICESLQHFYIIHPIQEQDAPTREQQQWAKAAATTVEKK